VSEERKERCETCRFWIGQRERISCRLPLLVADCHRYPPSRYLRDSDGDPPQFEQWFRPEMLSDEWCGEWEPINSEIASSQDIEAFLKTVPDLKSIENLLHELHYG
jgi:hypothetical protein